MPKVIDMEDVMKKTSSSLRAKYLLTAAGKSRLLAGESREDIVKTFLQDHLPRNLGFERGEVFNREGAISRQVDIIVHDLAIPVFNSSSLSLFPIESVVATCEVKSTLDKERLSQAVDNVQSVKRLVKTPASTSTPPIMPPYGTVFAFKGTSETIRKNLERLYKEKSVAPDEQLNLVCVLDKFIGIGYPGNQGLAFDNDNVTEQPLVFLNTGEDSLLMFLTILVGALRLRASTQFNLWAYLKPKNYKIF